MLALWIILGFLLMLLIVLLFSPMILYINSESELYFFQITGLIRIRLLFQSDIVKLKVTIFFIPFDVDPSRWITGTKKKDKKKSGKKRQKTLKKRKRHFFKKVKLFGDYGVRVINTFDIRQFRLNFDTNDFILNAKLIPLVTCINNEYENVLITINFFEQNLIILKMRNRLINLLYLSIKYLLFKMRKINKTV